MFFEDQSNSWFGKEAIFRGIADYHLLHGEHGPDYDDVSVLQAQSRWNDYLELFDKVTVEDK